MRAAVLFLVIVLSACSAPENGASPTAAPGDTAPTASSTQTTEGCADVVDVVASPDDDGTWRFEVTVASADTGWDKYADRWEVRLPDGTVAGTRELAHPHVEEQPFTRSLGGVEVPPDVAGVTVAAHDSVAGFCGTTATVDLTG